MYLRVFFWKDAVLYSKRICFHVVASEYVHSLSYRVLDLLIFIHKFYTFIIIITVTTIDSWFTVCLLNSRPAMLNNTLHANWHIIYSCVQFSRTYSWVFVQTLESYFNIDVYYRETLTYPLISMLKWCCSKPMEIRVCWIENDNACTICNVILTR